MYNNIILFFSILNKLIAKQLLIVGIEIVLVGTWSMSHIMVEWGASPDCIRCSKLYIFNNPSAFAHFTMLSLIILIETTSLIVSLHLIRHLSTSTGYISFILRNFNNFNWYIMLVQYFYQKTKKIRSVNQKNITTFIEDKIEKFEKQHTTRFNLLNQPTTNILSYYQ